MMKRTFCRSIAIVLPALLPLLCACNSNGDDHVSPVHASVATPNPVPAGPAVYLRVAASDDPGDDLVPLEVVLIPGAAPVMFDAYNVEILPTDPSNPNVLRDGVQQMVFDAVAGSTPFGTCGACVSGGALCGFCVPCGSCAPGTLINQVNTPTCFTDCCSDNHTFQLRVQSVTASGCAPVTANSEIVLGVVTVFTRTPGNVRLRFRVVPNVTGDCEILLQNAEQSIAFDDRGAIFTASR
ncbi:MAG TPA: hypothetical protein VFQ07_02185 [Candidatus Polarisedimenticolia bacterium]|nr:hypothetical protein [Candidatus Polarisedimenticolia bacterium]